MKTSFLSVLFCVFACVGAHAGDSTGASAPTGLGVITGQDVAKLMAARTASAPVADVAKPVTQPGRPDPVLTWEIQESDKTLRTTLERWGRVAHWDVQWRGAPDVYYLGYANFPDQDFLHAADYVLSKAKVAAKAGEIDLVFSIRPNRVLLITTAAQHAQPTPP